MRIYIPTITTCLMWLIGFRRYNEFYAILEIGRPTIGKPKRKK